MTPVAVTIAGSDSGGGAGLQGDLKTFSALGVYGASVVTALTAQSTRGVTAIHDLPPDFVAAQIDAVFSDLRPAAVKIGMVSRPETIHAIAAGLDRFRPAHVVLDPVMMASSGDRLLAAEAIDVLMRELLPRASVVTPNLPEAAALVGGSPARTEDEMKAQARRLLALGAKAVVIKGGHASGPTSIDLMVDRETVVALRLERIAAHNSHGTGCAFSAAIAAGLAQGMELEPAVRAAKRYVHGAIAAADRLAIGSGNGPIHHFHGVWPGALSSS
jgi:hydroxymethylpyrimidine/phosphomethylpyrimidine kinase